jgi:hypothetical protein
VAIYNLNSNSHLCKTAKNSTFGFVRTWNLLAANSLNYYRKEAAMYILAAVIIVLLIALAGAELFLAQFNADELSNMGVEKK